VIQVHTMSIGVVKLTSQIYIESNIKYFPYLELPRLPFPRRGVMNSPSPSLLALSRASGS
jgi:hypothetical protein